MTITELLQVFTEWCGHHDTHVHWNQHDEFFIMYKTSYHIFQNQDLVLETKLFMVIIKIKLARN